MSRSSQGVLGRVAPGLRPRDRAVADAAMGQTFQDLSKSFLRRYGILGFDIYNPLAMVSQRVRGYFIEKDGTVTNASAYDASKKYPAGASPRPSLNRLD